jgi:hypothetical protein
MQRRPRPVKAGVRLNVPAGESAQMLSTITVIVLTAIWAAVVTGTIFWAPAAHLPPTGTIGLIILETATVIVLGRAAHPRALRGRRDTRRG